MKFKKSKLEPVLVEIDGVTYPAKLTFAGYAELEEIYQKSITDILGEFGGGNVSMKLMLDILFVAMKHEGVVLARQDLNEIPFSQQLVKQIMEICDRSLKLEKPAPAGNSDESIDEKKTEMPAEN